MADRFKYSEVRQKIIDAIRTDLIGPREKEEVLDENPRFAYLVGMLDVQTDEEDRSGAGEQEIDADMAFEDGEDFTAGQDDDNEPISTTRFQLPSSIGISFYVKSDLPGINLDVSWGDYSRSSEKFKGKDEKEHIRTIYTRIPMAETVHVNFADFTRTKNYQLVCDSNVHVHVSRIGLKLSCSKWNSRHMRRMVLLCLLQNIYAGKSLRQMSSILSNGRSLAVAVVVLLYGIRL